MWFSAAGIKIRVARTDKNPPVINYSILISDERSNRDGQAHVYDEYNGGCQLTDVDTVEVLLNVTGEDSKHDEAKNRIEDGLRHT